MTTISGLDTTNKLQHMAGTLEYTGADNKFSGSIFTKLGAKSPVSPVTPTYDTGTELQLKQAKREAEKLKKQIENTSDESVKKTLQTRLKSLNMRIKWMGQQVEQEKNVAAMISQAFNDNITKAFAKADRGVESRDDSEALKDVKTTHKLSTNINNSGYNEKTGEAIAEEAESVAGKTNTVGKCYRGVKNSLKKFGVNLEGGSAYQAASQLADNDNFKEVKVDRDELKELPAGAVVVWDKSAGKQHGHISIALGDGREASDHIQQQMTSRPKYRVFLPTATMDEA